MRHIFSLLAMCLCIAMTLNFSMAHAQTNLAGNWHVQVENGHYGTLESLLLLEADGDIWLARTHSIALSISIDATDRINGLVSIGDGEPIPFETMLRPDGNFSTDIASGPFSGNWHFSKSEAASLERNYASLNGAMSAIMQQWFYDPRLLQDPAFVNFQAGFAEVVSNAQDDIDLVVGFQNVWDGALFSHFEILRPLNTMDGLLEEADEQAEDRPIARYEALNEDTALVTIDTFFGLAIEEQIDTVMNVAIQSEASNLIIDLRENPGGTTAAVPVGARLLQEPGVFGYFLGNSWWQQNDALPSLAELEARPFMNNRDRREMMGELVQTGLISARLEPKDPTFDGHVYVLISERSGSATEATVGMIKMADRATLVGETTAGRMLNSNFFPLPHDFTLRIPIADFYLSDGTRIDGIGVAPDVTVPDEDALNEALRLIDSRN